MLDINYVRNNAKNLEKENKELNEKINVYIRKNERLQQQLSKQEKRWNDLKEWTESIRPYYPDDNNHLQLFKDKIKELEEQE